MLLMFLAIPCWSQSTGKAETSGPCSPAVTGSGNEFTINCKGIDKEQGQKILDILNKILANQLDSKSITEKLDELFKLISQRLPADRRLSPEQKVELVACLRTNPGKFIINAMGTTPAYNYAQDWFEVFYGAGWTNGQPIPIGTGLTRGGLPPIQFSVHGTFNETTKVVSMAIDSPEQNFFMCLNKIPIGEGALLIPSNENPAGTVVIFVSDRPNQPQ